MRRGGRGPRSHPARHFDYIIAGGGAAGCVLAGRLSANPRLRVLLIEAGLDTPPGGTPADILDPYPSSYANPAYRWPIRGHALTAETSPAAPLLHARVMGGGSSIMGMIMLRGTPDDYDGWARAGADGWSWRDTLPYFRKLESDLDFSGPMHGADGPTEIRRHRRADWPPLAQAGLRYAERCGAPFIADMNADFSDGYGALPIAGPADRRASSAISYLTAEVRARRNLAILPGTTVEALLFEGSRVVGVRVRGAVEAETFEARETILAMGALLTPAFLQAQGVGDPDRLAAAGVEVRAAARGVGANLQNHAAVLVMAHLRAVAVQRRPQRNHNNSMFRYTSGTPGCGRSDMALALGSRASWHAVASRLAHFSPLLMSPQSRGRVSLKRAENGDLAPRVEFDLLGDPRDEMRLLEGLRRIDDLVRAPELASLIGPAVGASRLRQAARFNPPTRWNALRTNVLGALMDAFPELGDGIVLSIGGPGGDLSTILADRDRAAAFVRGHVMAVGHHAGTCRMGRASDPMAVVDAEGRVHAVAGLRVVDASVMPTVPRANTNLPVLMIAEKVSDAILREASGSPRLPDPSSAPGAGPDDVRRPVRR